MLDVKAQLHGDRLKVSLFLSGLLMDFQSSFDLLRGHLLALAVLAIDSDALA